MKLAAPWAYLEDKMGQRGLQCFYQYLSILINQPFLKLSCKFLIRCNETDKLEKYAKLNYKLTLADENEVFKLTGCLSPCEKFEYSLTPMTDLFYAPTNSKELAKKVLIHLYFTTGRHDVREQVGKEIHNFEHICSFLFYSFF